MVFLSVLLDLGLVGVRAGGGEDAGDFDKRPDIGGGDPAERADTPPLSSCNKGVVSEDNLTLDAD